MMDEDTIITTAGVLLGRLRPGEIFPLSLHKHYGNVLSTIPIAHLLACAIDPEYNPANLFQAAQEQASQQEGNQ